MVACGSAYHAAMAAQYVIEDLAHIPVRVELASEFRYRRPCCWTKRDWLSSSVSPARPQTLWRPFVRPKSMGIRTLAIVNVVGSSIAREADNVFYTLAGPEISVATTKAYSTQLLACDILAVQFAKVRGAIDEDRYRSLIAEMGTLPEKITPDTSG